MLNPKICKCCLDLMNFLLSQHFFYFYFNHLVGVHSLIPITCFTRLLPASQNEAFKKANKERRIKYGAVKIVKIKQILLTLKKIKINKKLIGGGACDS